MYDVKQNLRMSEVATTVLLVWKTNGPPGKSAFPSFVVVRHYLYQLPSPVSLTSQFVACLTTLYFVVTQFSYEIVCMICFRI